MRCGNILLYFINFLMYFIFFFGIDLFYCIFLCFFHLGGNKRIFCFFDMWFFFWKNMKDLWKKRSRKWTARKLFRNDIMIALEKYFGLRVKLVVRYYHFIFVLFLSNIVALWFFNLFLVWGNRLFWWCYWFFWRSLRWVFC
jgi:hypothetical protein